MDASRGQPATRPRASAVLVYAPGLRRYTTNTAANVADVLAALLDRSRPGSYRAEATTETAPRGLRAGKTVIDPAGRPVLEVFELDYRAKLTDEGTGDTPPPQPGLLSVLGYTVYSVALLVAAVRRPTKSRIAKFQLVAGVLACSALVFTAASAVLATLAAMGLLTGLPEWLKDLPLESSNARTVAVTASGASVAAWYAARRTLVGFAAAVRQNVRYATEERHRDSAAQTLDEAIDALLDNGWTGPVHVLGYSFGALVVVDALFPGGARRPGADRVAAAVTTLTTVGWPVDLMQLYFPRYLAKRTARKHLDWTNVYIPADIWASDFAAGAVAGKAGRPATEGRKPAGARSEPQPPAFAGVPMRNVQYTDERLEWSTVLRMRGLRTHGGYWDTPRNASCFAARVDDWVPPLAPSGTDAVDQVASDAGADAVPAVSAPEPQRVRARNGRSSGAQPG